MDRPKRKDFENGNHVGDWLYWEQKYNKALEAYVDMLEQKLTLTAVVKSFYCFNKGVGYRDSICVNQCLMCYKSNEKQ